MLPWLGSTVAAAPLALRTLAYTSSWVAHSLIVQMLVWGVLTVYNRNGLSKKNTREPALPVSRMLLADVFGYYSWMIGAGLVQAW
jgi:hypothetical protein